MMGGGLMMDQGMVFPGVHNFVDLLQQNGDKNLGFGPLFYISPVKQQHNIFYNVFHRLR